MLRWISPLIVFSLAGCGYMTQKRYDELWDWDEDGFGVGEDCNDAEPEIYPWAPDVRGDGCDADCGKEPDADGDDWPDDADCAPDDPDVFPCNPAETDNDGVDSDCDGNDGVRTIACSDAPGIDQNHGLDPDFPPAFGGAGSVTQRSFPADCLPDSDDDDDDD